MCCSGIAWLIRLVDFFCLKNYIVSKFCFHPPSPSYQVKKIDKEGTKSCFIVMDRLNMNMGSDFAIKEIKVARRVSLLSYYIKKKEPKLCVIYLHGNAIDIGAMLGYLICFSKKFNVSVFTYDYRGYGLSDGKSSIKNIYSDSEIVYDEFLKAEGINPEKVVMMGHSLGTVVGFHLAERNEKKFETKIGGLVILSAFLSGLKIYTIDVEDDLGNKDFFNNEKAIEGVSAPLFIIHGNKDEIIPFKHAKILSEKASNLYEFWAIDGADHNGVFEKNRVEFENKIASFFCHICADTNK